MGYTTYFSGEVTVEPPLNQDEIAYLRDFNQSRRMDREEGPYHAVPGSDHGQTSTPGVRNYNGPPDGQPGLWCQWTPSDDGSYIAWDEGEKFYNAWEWMLYLINHFLMPGAVASQNLADSVRQDPRFQAFTFDHVLNGEIFAEGEDRDDTWKLVVVDNVVKTAQAQITWPEPT